MPYKPDLQPVNLWGLDDPACLAVGWLDPAHPFSRGNVPSDVFEKLCSLALKPWAPYMEAGIHLCGFCRFTGGPAIITYEGIQVQLGNGHLCIPHGKQLFIAPVSILHYIDAHEYAPPDPFLEAVLECPEMNSIKYYKKLLDTPVRTFLANRRASTLPPR